MSRKHASLPNQYRLPLSSFDKSFNAALLGPNSRPRLADSIPPATIRLDDGNGRPLADAGRGGLAGLRQSDREDWFVPPDASDGSDSTVADPADADSANADPAETDDCDCGKPASIDA